MFQFSHLPLRTPNTFEVIRLFIETGFPIRTSPAKLARQLTEAYRRLAASFIGSWRLGIPREPLILAYSNLHNLF